MKIKSVLEASLYTEDLASAEVFYTNILKLTLISKTADRHLFFRCGEGVLLIFNPHTTSNAQEVPAHGASGPSHIAFAVDSKELEEWRKHLKIHDIQIEKEVAWGSGDHSLYFRDPAGNSLELVSPRIWDENHPAQRY